MIPVKPDTKAELDSIMPKAWTYDQIVTNLVAMWKKRVAKSGKLVEDNQTS